MMSCVRCIPRYRVLPHPEIPERLVVDHNEHAFIARALRLPFALQPSFNGASGLLRRIQIGHIILCTPKQHQQQQNPPEAAPLSVPCHSFPLFFCAAFACVRRVLHHSARHTEISVRSARIAVRGLQNAHRRSIIAHIAHKKGASARCTLEIRQRRLLSPKEKFC